MDVGCADESVEEAVEKEELEGVLMALASLSASNEMATEAKETDVYTILSVSCKDANRMTYLRVCWGRLI